MEKRRFFNVRNEFVKLLVLFRGNIFFWLFPQGGDLICLFAADHYRKTYKV